MKVAPHDIPHHFTASGIVICNDHVLLVNHKRIGAWVPPGGHIEANELPHETVVREILEETGVLVEIVSDMEFAPLDADAFFLHSPLYVQSVLAIESGERFYHIDLTYLCRPANLEGVNAPTLPDIEANPEVKEARWVKFSEMGNFKLAKNVEPALELAKSKIKQQCAS